ncbi:unnamed protein product [Cunninghamella blakesleeana]
MTYRDSFLSLYQPTNINSSPGMSLDSVPAGAELPAQFEEELPATTPVFEGHLYLRTSSKQWDWRLFRFDGTSFICLSSRKVKLPPNTHLHAPVNDLHFLKTSPSLNASFTSPLLATPKNKTQQISELITNNKSHNNNNNNTGSPVIASYYQLPKWSVDIINISAVSVLKPKKKSKLSVSTQKPSKCFCIRTFTGECYIMKASKQKDLERWLFVLTKMWKFTQAMRSQLVSNMNPPQQQLYNHPTSSSHLPLQQPPSLPQHHPHPNYLPHPIHHPNQQQQPHPHPYYSSTNATNHMMYSSSSNNLLHHQHQQIASLPPNHDDSISLSQLYKRPQHRTLTSTNSPLIYNPHPHPHPQHKLPLVVTNGSTPSPPHLQPSTSSGRMDNNSIHDKNYSHPILSVEKAECIDAWRKSLSELMASDPQLQVSIPPPIESIPEDDQVSIISDMTSISHRQPNNNNNNLRRRISVSSSISKRSLKSNKIKPRDNNNNNNNNTMVLKKKRSDDVKNWIEPRKLDNINNHQKNKLDNNNKNENRLSSSLPHNTFTRNNNNKTHPQVPPIDTYQINYFQDCITPARSTLSSPLTNNNNDDNNNNEIINYKNNSNDTKKTTVTLNQNTKYYGSAAAKPIKIVNRRSSSISSLSSSSTSSSALAPKVTHEVPNQSQHVNSATSVRPTSSFTSSSHDNLPEISLGVGRGERRSLDYTSSHRQHHHHHHRKSSSSSLLSSPPLPSLYSPTSMMIESPLQTLSNVNRKSKDEDEISLADLQRSLKRASLQNNNSIKNPLPFSTSTITHHTGGTTTTTSATTTTTNSMNQQPLSPNYSFRQSTSTSRKYNNSSHNNHNNNNNNSNNNNNNNNNGSSSIVVAPAIPPMPSKSRNSLLSIPFYNNDSDNNNNNSKSSSMKLSQNHRESMKLSKNHKESMTLNRPHSWIPFDHHQQKIVQQPSSRQSMQMDNTVQW